MRGRHVERHRAPSGDGAGGRAWRGRERGGGMDGRSAKSTGGRWGCCSMELSGGIAMGADATIAVARPRVSTPLGIHGVALLGRAGVRELCIDPSRGLSCGQRTGRSAAWLARLTGGQEVGGSNPLAPIQLQSPAGQGLAGLSLFGAGDGGAGSDGRRVRCAHHRDLSRRHRSSAQPASWWPASWRHTCPASWRRGPRRRRSRHRSSGRLARPGSAPRAAHPRRGRAG
jgi:hypothetical protein